MGVGQVVGRIVPQQKVLTPEERFERNRLWISRQLKDNPCLRSMKRVAPQAPAEIIEALEK